MTQVGASPVDPQVYKSNKKNTFLDLPLLNFYHMRPEFKTVQLISVFVF